MKKYYFYNCDLDDIPTKYHKFAWGVMHLDLEDANICEAITEHLSRTMDIPTNCQVNVKSFNNLEHT